MRNDEWVLGSGFEVLGKTIQNPTPNTQHPLSIHHSSFRTHHSSLLLRKNLSERRQQFVVLLVRADAHAEVVAEHRVAAHVADEYVAREQFAEDALRLDRGADDHEVRV